MTTFGPDALALALRGWSVFPCQLVNEQDCVVALADATPDMKLKKVPIGTLVERGFKEATKNPKRIALWARVAPDALIGVAMPQNTVALDVDVLEDFAAAGLEMPEAPTQQTLRGGYHKLFKTDGRRVRQTVKEIPGADTRVGGLGYVIAWEPEAFPEVATLPDAPEWLYSGDSDEPRTTEDDPTRPLSIRRVKRTVEVATFKVGERDNALARFAGMMRREGAGPDAIYAAMKAMLENGQIESPPDDKMTDKDLKRIAGSIGTKQSAEVDKQRRPAPQRYFANDILATDYGELVYFIDELLPEGVGIIGGAPKIGKSWLVLQAAMETADGTGTLLDRAIPTSQPVLYYALEDGPRRAQLRMETLKGFHNIDTTMLEFRFEAPLLGEGLEDDIERWVVDNKGGVVFIDVLAMVQPETRSRGSAYNADYTMLRDIRTRMKNVRTNQGIAAAVTFVTHVRKMGAEDPFATLQGTTGVTGSTDWTWVIKRGRMDAKGTIQITGRDIAKEPYIEAVFNGLWTAVGSTHRGGSKQRNNILDTLLTEGDLTTAQVRRYVNDNILDPGATPLTNNGVNEKLNAMQTGGLVEQTDVYIKGKDGGYVWHAFSQEEIEAVGRAAVIEATKAETASGHGRGVRITRSTATERTTEQASRAPAGRPAQERPRPHAPQAPHLDLEPIESVEGEEGALRAPGRVRGRAQRKESDNDGE